MTNKMKIYLVPYWMPFPSSEYGGLECIIAENDEKQRKIEEWNAEMKRRRESPFATIMSGLTKVGDFASDILSTVGGPVGQTVASVYQNFAPPGTNGTSSGPESGQILVVLPNRWARKSLTFAST